MKQQVADALDSTIDELFPAELALVKSNKVVKAIDVPTALVLAGNSERLRLESGQKYAFAKVDREDAKKHFDQIMDTLSERESDVLRERFGLDSGYPKTLEEVAKKFNVSRERLRQVEAKAIRKMRHPTRAKKLKEIYR